MAMQVGFCGAFTRAFAVTEHHHEPVRFLFCDPPGCGSSIHALRGHAVKSDETSHFPLSKIDKKSPIHIRNFRY